ncbi:GNAT family N-acetyltransferase [Macrococcoides bohemicum]|uniref:GNAT family N-acetyltransferase n=1 Tax=Macrococcoides bohemicum TaxID=1903056 RepID=UPI00165DAC7F|nr:GNAT family N-acetyltransferase [Macrococcus bohemicus]MBC9873256.1 GNAT family N-acetyltransferase [Macrococcus bohemicus]
MFEINESSQATNDYIHQKIKEYNEPNWRDRKLFNFNIEDNGKVIAGIVGESTFSTIEIEFLFVDESYRKHGLGTKLLTYVEEKGRREGLKHVYLNTFSFQASKFYEKHGYKLLFNIDNCYGDIGQYFYWKDL